MCASDQGTTRSDRGRLTGGSVLLFATLVLIAAGPAGAAVMRPQYQCYGFGPTAPFATRRNIALQNVFESWTADVKSPPRVCAPADVTGEGTTTHLEAEHLVGCAVSGESGSARTSLSVEDALGSSAMASVSCR